MSKKAAPKTVEKKPKEPVLNLLMDETEMVGSPCEVIPEKNNPVNYIQAFLLYQISRSNIDGILAKECIDISKSSQNSIVDGIKGGLILIPKFAPEGDASVRLLPNNLPNQSNTLSLPTKPTISELIGLNKSKSTTLKAKNELQEMEESNKNLKLKDFQEKLVELRNKEKSLNESIKIIESSGALSNNKTAENIIEKNIKRDKIKELKEIKSVIDSKISATEIIIKKLTANQMDIQTKKIHLKEYLENIDKAKQSTLEKYKKWEIERDEKIQQFSNIQERLEERRKDELQQAKEEIESKRREFHARQLEIDKERIQKGKEKAEKVMEEMNNNAESKQTYLYYQKQKRYKNKVSKEKQKYDDKVKEEKERRKNIMKSVTREELEDFQRDYLDKKTEKINELEQSRLQKAEEIVNSNSQLNINYDTEFYKKILEEEKELKDNNERIKDEKAYKSIKVKNYASEIKSLRLPRIDDLKKKELEERVQKLAKQVSQKHIKRKYPYVVVLKKKHLNSSSGNLPLVTDPNHPDSKSRSPSPRKFLVLTEADQVVKPKLKPVVVKQPLAKKPNYLEELKKKRSFDDLHRSYENESADTFDRKKWEKMIHNNKYSLVENVEMIRHKVEKLEERTRMDEKLMEYNGGVAKNLKVGEKMTNMIIDTIKAKLTILDQVAHDDSERSGTRERTDSL